MKDLWLWYRWPHVLYIYIGILLCGIVLNWIIPLDLKSWVTISVYPFKHGNLINEIFAYHGNTIWNWLFLTVAVMNGYILTKEWDPLLANGNRNGTTNQNNKKQTLIKIFKSFLFKLIIKNLLLFITFMFIDRLFIWTGGHCALDSTSPTSNPRIIVDSELCRAHKGNWIGGFDISGHFCFLINISLILWIELYQLEKWLTHHSLNWDQIYRANKYIKWAHYTIISVLSVWIFLLITTSVFYHTLFEKVLGYLLGYVCPLVIYYLIPHYLPSEL
ncbi:acyl-coenzyme A diphosphatase Yft2p [Monosporozyma unispora]